MRVCVCVCVLCVSVTQVVSADVHEVVYPAPALVRAGEPLKCRGVPAPDRAVVGPRVHAPLLVERERADSPLVSHVCVVLIFRLS